MLGGRLKWTDAEQRTEDFRRQSYRLSWWLWTPLYVLVLVAYWTVVLFLFNLHSQGRWFSLAAVVLVTIVGIRMWKARH